MLDAVRDSGQVAPERFPQVFGSISFFVNAGIRFVEEICKLRAFTDAVGPHRRRALRRRRTPRLRRFRYGVQVNSLGLTEAQPENNVQRIVLEMLAVTLSKRARARSVQLPAWNEALGLPRPWDQQWSLRMQQVLAYETDLLEYERHLRRLHVVEARTAELVEAASAELDDVLALGGAFEAVDELKGRLVRSMAERTRRIESGEQVVVGVNRFTETEPSPLGGGRVDPRASIPPSRPRWSADVEAWRRRPRRRRRAGARSTSCGGRPSPTENVMPATIALAQRRRHHRRVGRRAARGVRRVPGADRRGAPPPDGRTAELAAVAERVKALAGGPPEAARGQARPRRPLQRRRADRRRRPRRRHGGRLLRHPAHPGADRGVGARRGPRRDRPVDPVGQPPRARARGAADCWRPRASTRRSWWAASSPRTTGRRCSARRAPPSTRPKDFELGRIMDEIVDLAEEHRATG